MAYGQSWAWYLFSMVSNKSCAANPLHPAWSWHRRPSTKDLQCWSLMACPNAVGSGAYTDWTNIPKPATTPFRVVALGRKQIFQWRTCVGQRPMFSHVWRIWANLSSPVVANTWGDGCDPIRPSCFVFHFPGYANNVFACDRRQCFSLGRHGKMFLKNFRKLIPWVQSRVPKSARPKSMECSESSWSGSEDLTGFILQNRDPTSVNLTHLQAPLWSVTWVFICLAFG